MMFPKVVFAFLTIGALSVNALTVTVARSPAPEPESRELEARFLDIVVTKKTGGGRRGIDLENRELEARGKRENLDEMFSREPEDWDGWVGFARDHYTAKREPSPGDGAPKPPSPPKPRPKPINDGHNLK